MKQLLPEQPKPLYKYESEEAANLTGTPIANRLLEKIKQRCLPEDIIQLLRESSDPSDGTDQIEDAAEDQSAIFNPLKIDVFTSTLLYFGSKSFSHIFAALAKYARPACDFSSDHFETVFFRRFHMIFKILVETEESQMIVLKTLHEVWKNHQQVRHLASTFHRLYTHLLLGR